MADTHALLAAARESGDLTPLLVLADLLGERADHASADLIRLTAADAVTARSSPDRARLLRLRRVEARNWGRDTPWPDIAVQPDAPAAGPARRTDSRPRCEPDDRPRG